MSRIARISLITACIFATLFALHVPQIAAQNTQPALPQPKVCTCIEMGMQLLAKYNIPPENLNNLITLVNDPAKLTATLKAFGLKDTDITSLITQAEPLLKENGLDLGALKTYVATKGLGILESNKIPQEDLDELLAVKSSAERLAILKEKGIDPASADKVVKELDPYFGLGLDRRALGYFWAEQGVEVLKQFNLPREALDEVVAGGNDKAPAVLAKYGLSPDAIKKVLGDFTELTQQGFANGDVKSYAVQEVEDLLARNGVPYDVALQGIQLFAQGKMDDLQKLAAEYNIGSAAFEEVKNGLLDLQKLGLNPADIVQEAKAAQDEVTVLQAEPISKAQGTDAELLQDAAQNTAGGETVPTPEAATSGGETASTPEATMSAGDANNAPPPTDQPAATEQTAS